MLHAARHTHCNPRADVTTCVLLLLPPLLLILPLAAPPPFALQVVGVHDGYWFYTVGQRGGIKLPGGPWYVTRKDMPTNTVYVSRTYYEQQRRRDAFVCGPVNWLGPGRPRQQRPLLVKVRHGPNVYECSLRLGSKAQALAMLEQGTPDSFQPLGSAGDSSSGSSGRSGSSDESGWGVGRVPGQQQEPEQYGVVLLSENDQGLAAGQYAVFYQDGECLGSAQIMGGLARSAGAASAGW